MLLLRLYVLDVALGIDFYGSFLSSRLISFFYNFIRFIRGNGARNPLKSLEYINRF